MTTTKSYSRDSGLFPSYISALKLQLPFAIVSGIVFLILFVVVFFASTANQYDPANMQHFFLNYFKQGIYADEAQSVIVFVFLSIMIFASALMGISYLHRKNTVDLYHSLPVTRPQLLSANLLASLTAVLGPFAAMYLLTMIIQLVTCARFNCFGPDYFLFIFFDITSAIVCTAIVAVFVAFVAVNVGTVFDAFSVTLITGFTPAGVYLVSGMIWQGIMYGASFEPNENTLYLSPFLFMFRRFWYFDRYYTSDGIAYARNYTGSAWLLLCGIILAAVFFIFAVVCYRRRKSEIAEQTQPRGFLQIIVRLVAAFVGGAMFYAIFGDIGFAARVILTFIGAVGVGIISELVLSRGVKWLGKNIKLLAGAGVAYCLILIFVQFDIFGYTTRLPEPEAISGVRISYDGRFGETDLYPYAYKSGDNAWLTETESIAVVREAHSMAVNNRPPVNFHNNDFDYSSLSIEYKLTNGSVMKRMYSPIYGEAFRKLAELEDNEDFIRANSALFWAQANPENSKVETVELYASFGRSGGQHANVLDAPNALLDAIRSDMLEQSLEDILDPKEPALGFIIVNLKAVDNRRLYDTAESRYAVYSSSDVRAVVTVTREYTRTLEALKRMNLNGGFDDGPLNLDDVVSVGLSPSMYYSYYNANRVRTFMRRPEDASWDYKTNYGEYQPGYLTLTDTESIRAVAQASKDALLTEGPDDWDKNYAIAYFEMTDGSTATKAVRLSELPEKISIAVRTHS